MRNSAFKYLLWFISLLLLSATAQGLWAADQYVYEQKDENEEKKRFIIKLEQDKRKSDLAIINTKTLIARSKNRPYLPELYLRLAELYIEKSRIAYFLRKSQQAEKGERALDQYESNVLKQRAIEIYQRILTQHPDFKHTDKVLFFMAHEYRELGQIEDMLKQYQLIISKYPGSQYAPESHLLLGDYYFNRKADVDKSKVHYEAVLKYPQSPAVAAARYKLAWCQINLADFKGAIKLFEESVKSPHSQKDLDIDTYRRVDVRLESLVDMAYCYPEVHKKATPEQALAYFKQYAWSRPVYTLVIEKLAYRYYVKKKWAKAGAIYRELAVLRQDPEKLLEYAKYIFESVQALGTYEHAEKDVAIIIRALEKQKYSAHVSQADKEKLVHDFELYARDIITHLHAKAQRSNSGADFKIASDAYKQYLQFFTDSAVVEEMAANYAETLFSSGQYLEAGKQYEKVAPEATVNTKQRQEMLYSAVISYYQALKKKDDLNFFQAAYAREGLRSTGKTYAAEFPNSPKTPDVLFNVAWVTYDAGHYKAAIDDFSNFVLQYAHHKAAKAAIHLIMDSFHLLDDFEGMIKYGNSVLANPSIQDRALKTEIAQIVSTAESKVVSSMTIAAMDDWESARSDLIQVAKKGGKSEMGEQALNALIVSSKEKNDLTTLFDAGNHLIRAYPQSAHVQNTLGILIDTSIKIGQFRLLADYLEQYVQKFPQDEHSADFLLQAAQIREGLGQYAKANAKYRRLLARSRSGSAQMDNLVFSIVDNAERLGNSDAALDVLIRYNKQLSKTGRIRAQAQIAVLSLRANRRSQARKYVQVAQKAYQPKMGEQDPLLREYMAEMAYSKVYASSGRYFDLKLKKKIDNKIVTRKAKLLQTLEDGYQQVMAYKSPHWALKACFRANEINREFADFLLNSPLPPDLNPAQKQQYMDLIRNKARAYTDKADQYLKSCVQLAQKWEICDPRLAGYFNPADNPQGREGYISSLSGGQACVEIGQKGLQNQTISTLYQKLLKSPDDHQLQFTLAKKYLKQGDYRQAALIVKNTLPKLNGNQRHLKANLLNTLGVTHLYNGQDPLAKETFKKALDADSALTVARINLAGIYRHYGHNDKAVGMIQDISTINLDPDGIHPRIGAIYNE